METMEVNQNISPTSSVQLRRAREREKVSNAGLPDEECWFHGNISRQEAEDKLRENGEEGCFLVRQTISGDYALSFLMDGLFHHIQIYRHDRDAFFSIEDGRVIHGLDELIRFYFLSSEGEDAKLLLKEPITQSPPPPDCRRHGRTNLLHRATKEGHTDIVSTLVSCGHRSLEAKNEQGQTAAHIAAMNGYSEILNILIVGGANTNARDSGGCTPLYYACMFNYPEAVTILLQNWNANPQLRSNNNGWVPLHEAASKGHNGCIKILLHNHAPLRPRTEDNKLPLDIATENNLTETSNLLRNYIHPDPLPNRDEWYHSCLDRQEALTLLQQCQITNLNDMQKCYFLLRRSANKKKVHVLTVLFQGNSYNFVIQRMGKFYYIDDGPYLESLEQIVNHYSRWSDGLPAAVHISVRPTQSFMTTSPFRSPSDPLLIPPPLPKRTPRSSPNNFALEPINNNKFPLYSKENIPSEWIEIGEQIGSGEYGEVFEGKLKIPGEIEMIVAVKTLKKEMIEMTKQDFLREARVMMNLEHNHIVRLIGLCWEPQIYMVQELLSLGSMQEYIVDHRDEVLPEPHIRLWAHQIAKGMLYFQEKRFVHRDLAARNILLSSRTVAKIGDFGLSRALNLDSNYYTASHGGKWPIKWYAPESCTHGTFSHASDVWSYGITLWEMYSYGETPYGELQGMEVIGLVEKGHRLEKPEYCPEKVFEVIRKCWSERPKDRPTFQFLVEFFAM